MLLALYQENFVTFLLEVLFRFGVRGTDWIRVLFSYFFESQLGIFIAAVIEVMTHYLDLGNSQFCVICASLSTARLYHQKTGSKCFGA
jgi:hypothetical protein